MDRSITGRRNYVQIHHRHHHVFSSKTFWSFIFIFVGLSDQRPSDCRTVGIRNHRTFGALDYINFLCMSCELHMAWVIIKIHVLFCYYAIKQISTKLIGETCFAWSHISFPWFYHLSSDWSNCEFILATQRPVFFLGVTVGKPTSASVTPPKAKNIYARADNNNPPGVAHNRNMYWRLLV